MCFGGKFLEGQMALDYIFHREIMSWGNSLGADVCEFNVWGICHKRIFLKNIPFSKKIPFLPSCWPAVGQKL